MSIWLFICLFAFQFMRIAWNKLNIWLKIPSRCSKRRVRRAKELGEPESWSAPVEMVYFSSGFHFAQTQEFDLIRAAARVAFCRDARFACDAKRNAARPAPSLQLGGNARVAHRVFPPMTLRRAPRPTWRHLCEARIGLGSARGLGRPPQ